MLRLLRLFFLGYWHDKPKPEVHMCRYTQIEELRKNTLRMGDKITSKVYVQRCKDCGRMSHYEIRA